MLPYMLQIMEWSPYTYVTQVEVVGFRSRKLAEAITRVSGLPCLVIQRPNMSVPLLVCSHLNVHTLHCLFYLCHCL